MIKCELCVCIAKGVESAAAYIYSLYNQLYWYLIATYITLNRATMNKMK